MAPEPLSELISTISKGMNLKIVLGQINANPDKLLHGRPPSLWRSGDHALAL
jgi:hypothetical protein